MKHSFKSLFAFAALLVLLPHPAQAQLDGAPVLSATQIARKIAPLHPKILVLVFDVTMSTMHNNIFALERAGAATLIREGCSVGDRVVLIKFGTGYTVVFNQVITDNAVKDTLVNQIPGHVEAGHGTNIRWPHVAALRMVQQALPRRKGVIVLLTDSFNDRPTLTDPNYPRYLDYYTLKGLTIYPHTPQNSAYMRLLRTLVVSGKVQQYGIGVGYAPDGRPIERIPAPGQGDSYVPPASTGGTTQQVAVGTETVRSSPLPWIIGVLLLLLVLFLLFWSWLNRAVPLRLKLGDTGRPRDYRLRPGSRVTLGGPAMPTAPGDEVFALSGIAVPAAFVLAGRGGALSLLPGKDSAVKVLHNGVPLESPTRLRPGDEARIVLPATDTTLASEHRVHVEDFR